jgi:hypothetical protein
VLGPATGITWPLTTLFKPGFTRAGPEGYIPIPFVSDRGPVGGTFFTGDEAGDDDGGGGGGGGAG